jgi:adenylate cyclase
VDPSRDGGGGRTATGLLCGSCGTELTPNSKFCNECGTPRAQVTRAAEYKQVTVLFADVVHSMDIAAAVGSERLREIMAQLLGRATEVVQRYDGTVDKFTGDGIMAVFGAPVALEDHAVRACVAALGVQDEAKQIAVTVRERDGVDLQLRVGLNSGEVVAGEIGSGALGYTAIGEQVGMAQRMESVAPPGGVMLSASTARLVDGAAVLGGPELVQIKSADAPVPARRLLGIGDGHRAAWRAESNLVGRRWEMSAVEGLLDRAIEGHGAVVGVVGLPGIGKSRLVREVTAKAAARGVDVFTAFCESHTTQIPFHAVARLLRAATEVEGLDAHAARAHIRDRYRDADPEDLLLFDDLLGIADPDIALPKIDPDARRRRLTALVNTAALARENPAVYTIEDAHWIDEVSESMLAEFLTVIPQTPSLVLVTYRPEYRGALTRVGGAQTVALAPLSDSEAAALVSELLGSDPTVAGLAHTITDRAAGNPFFAEEIVRELAERGVLNGKPGAYSSTAGVAEVTVPATLQATIAARVDRLEPKAKRTLSAAAVVGSRFNLDLLTMLGVEPVTPDLVAAQLIDQVKFTQQPEYVFHHPLIRAVAYEAQLKSDRVQLHRRLATAIQERDPETADENAALIAEHLEAAGDLHGAYSWHMRAGAWSTNRDITAARISLQRARQVADRLPADDPDSASMIITPRTLLCGSTWRVGGSVADTGFDELRELTTAAGDHVSLAIAMAGMLMTQTLHHQYRESSRLASEQAELLESIGDPTMTVGLLYGANFAKLQAGEAVEAMQLAQRVIDLAAGDPCKGNLLVGSPLALALTIRGLARCSLGHPGWSDDVHQAVRTARAVDSTSEVMVTAYSYSFAITNGAILPDATAMRDTAAALQAAEQSGDDVTLVLAQIARGIILIHRKDPEQGIGSDMLAEFREAALRQRNLIAVRLVDIHIAEQKAQTGEIAGAIEMSRGIVDDAFDTGETIWNGPATAVLVESLLRRGADADLQEAHAAVDRLAAVPTDHRFVLHEIWLQRLRALLARARGDEAAYREYRDRYRAMATSLGFEGHMKWAEAML